jgi:molecular chaperone GrpE (heat shock protein)
LSKTSLLHLQEEVDNYFNSKIKEQLQSVHQKISNVSRTIVPPMSHLDRLCSFIKELAEKFEPDEVSF